MDDYDARDRYYLSGEDDIGFRSQSTQPQRTPWDESPRRRGKGDDDDYFGSRRRKSTADGGSRDRSPHRQDRSSSYRPRRRESRDEHEYDRDRHESSDRRRSRHDAPPMLRRQSSSAPPPEGRSTYPPSSGGRRERSKYPPSTTETRNYNRGRRQSYSDHDHDRGRQSRSSQDSDRTGRGKSKSKKESSFSDVPWSQAARCALEAGTMAALRSYDAPGNWIGVKGAQIATAAVGAALVDGVIANKKPNIRGGKRHAVLRQVTNTALGNLIMTPAGKTVEAKEPVAKTKNAIYNRMHRGGGRRR